jgi:hypothetical protein
MIAVGVLATLAFAERMRRQRAICRDLAASYAEREREARNFVLAYERHLTDCRARLQKLRKGAEDCKDPQSIEKFLPRTHRMHRINDRPGCPIF